MTKLKHFSVLSISLILALIFCSTSTIAQPKEFYTPKALILPGHYDQNQVFASLGYDGGFDLNISRTIPHNFVLFATGNLDFFSHHRREAISADYKIFKSDYAWSAGVGRYKFDRHNFINIIEYYAGVGTTSINNYRSYPQTTSNQDWFTEASYLGIYTQMNAMVKREKVYFGLATRLTYNQYNSFSFYTRPKNLVTSNVNKFNLLNFEPAFSFSYILANFRGNAQVGVSIPLYSQDTELVDTGGNVEVETYGDFYFFWRISLQVMKKREVKRR